MVGFAPQFVKQGFFKHLDIAPRPSSRVSYPKRRCVWSFFLHASLCASTYRRRRHSGLHCASCFFPDGVVAGPFSCVHLLYADALGLHCAHRASTFRSCEFRTPLLLFPRRRCSVPFFLRASNEGLPRPRVARAQKGKSVASVPPFS